MLYANSVTPQKKLSPIEMLMQNPELMAQFEAQAQQEQGMPPQAPQGAPQSQMQPQMGIAPQEPQMAPQEAPAQIGMPMVKGYLNDEDYGRDVYEENQPKKKLGLLGRIKQQAGGQQALLAFGANMLSSNDFFDGLGKGATAYQNTLDAEAEKRKPKTSMIGNGAFQAVYDPVTGTTSYERTPFADFEENNLSTKLLTQEKVGQNRVNAQIDMNNADNDSAYKRLQTELTAAKGKEEREDVFRRWEKRYDRETDLLVADATAAGTSGKPPPPAVSRMITEFNQDASYFRETGDQLKEVIGTISRGELPLSLANSFGYQAALKTGVGVTDAARNYDQLKSLVVRMESAILRSNTGVQTNFDAERAALEVAVNSNDEKAVLRSLRRMERIVSNGQSLAETEAADLASQYQSSNSTARRSSQNSAAPKSALKAKYGLE